MFISPLHFVWKIKGAAREIAELTALLQLLKFKQGISHLSADHQMLWKFITACNLHLRYFRETSVHFTDVRIRGKVYCLSTDHLIVLFSNSGYDHHGDWGKDDENLRATTMGGDTHSLKILNFELLSFLSLTHDHISLFRLLFCQFVGQDCCYL